MIHNKREYIMRTSKGHRRGLSSMIHNKGYYIITYLRAEPQQEAVTSSATGARDTREVMFLTFTVYLKQISLLDEQEAAIVEYLEQEIAPLLQQAQTKDHESPW
jgi:hypothetical protein